MLTVIWVVMLFSRQFRFPFVLPLHSMLLCIPLRVVRFSLLKNIFLPFISFRRRSNFECICCITDATKPVSSYAAPRRSTLLCITAPEAACYCSWQWAQRSGRYRIQGGGKTITVRDSGFGLQMVIDAGELCGRIRRRNTACCWYENELTWYGCVCENVRCKSGVVRALPLALSVGYRMLVAWIIPFRRRGLFVNSFRRCRGLSPTVPGTSRTKRPVCQPR